MRTTEGLIGEFGIRNHAPLNKIGQVKEWLSCQQVLRDRKHAICVLSRTCACVEKHFALRVDTITKNGDIMTNP